MKVTGHSPNASSLSWLMHCVVPHSAQQCCCITSCMRFIKLHKCILLLYVRTSNRSLLLPPPAALDTEMLQHDVSSDNLQRSIGTLLCLSFVCTLCSAVLLSFCVCRLETEATYTRCHAKSEAEKTRKSQIIQEFSQKVNNSKRKTETLSAEVSRCIHEIILHF